MDEERFQTLGVLGGGGEAGPAALRSPREARPFAEHMRILAAWLSSWSLKRR
jgi:hypothetical protein